MLRRLARLADTSTASLSLWLLDGVCSVASYKDTLNVHDAAVQVEVSPT
jgi:hypothetical protein